jgi:DNA-binding winged helix-turn-helix (wHTH) protein
MERIIQSGAVTFYPERFLVTHAGASVTLLPRMCRLLSALAERHGRVMTIGQIMDAIDPDVQVEEVTVRKNISRLRQQLRKIGADQIENIHGAGYRWVMPNELTYAGTVEGGPLDGQKIATKQPVFSYPVLIGPHGVSGGPRIMELHWYRHEKRDGGGAAWVVHQARREGRQVGHRFASSSRTSA